MAIAPLQIPSSNINNLVDQSQWSSLANLGNVYKQAQEDAAKQTALSQLGRGVDADAATLLHSGVPSLASIGLNMQQSALNRQREDARYAVTDKRAEAELAIQQATAKRVQDDWEDKSRKEAAARAAFLAGGQPAAVAPDPAFTQGAPPIAPSPALPQAPPVAPVAQPMQQAVPLAPGQMPPGAPGEPAVPLAPQAPVAPPIAPSPIAPSQLQATGAMSPTDPVANRIVSNLVSGRPAAAAGFTREQLADMMQDPTYGKLATAMLQKMYSPDEFEYKVSDDGNKVIAINKTRGTVADLTPPTKSGEPAPTKEEREVQGYYRAGKNLGMNDDQARAFAANKGKVPSQDLRPGEETRINKLTDEARTAQRTLDNVAQLRTLSKDAWGFPGAETASSYVSALPGFVPGVKGAVDTQDLINAAHNNVVNVARTYFPQRVTNMDVNLLQDLEGSAGKSDAVRQKIYDRVDHVMSKIVEENNADAEAIRNKSFYKPGGGAAAPTATAPPAAPAAKPTLGEFMSKARAANPGYTDSEIANEWKRRYGS